MHIKAQNVLICTGSYFLLNEIAYFKLTDIAGHFEIPYHEQHFHLRRRVWVGPHVA